MKGKDLGICEELGEGQRASILALTPAARCSAYINLTPSPKRAGNIIKGSTKSGRQDLQ